MYNKVLKIVLAVVAAVGVLGLVLSLNSTAMRDEKKAAALEHLDYYKSFTLRGLDGEKITQDDLKANKVTVFNGWAPWCNPCTSEMPELEKLNNEYKGKGLQIVGVVADYYSKAQSGDTSSYDEQIRQVISATGVTYPVFVADKEFNDALLITMDGFPTTWAVDSEGNVLEIAPGARSAENWRKLFDKWLEEAK